MTRQQYQYIVATQLEALNERIDALIVYGQSYAKEARMHKMLLRQLRRLQEEGLTARAWKFLTVPIQAFG